MINDLLDKFFKKYSQNIYNVPNVNVSFDWEDENQKSAYITTPNLELIPSHYEDFQFYRDLTGNKENMRSCATGEPWENELSDEWLNAWAARWDKKNPFSSFTVNLKDEDIKIGHVSFGTDIDKSSAPNNATEISYIFDTKFHGNGYASEAVWSVTNTYADTLYANKYLCDGYEFNGIHARVRPDNPASIVVLLKSGVDICSPDPIDTHWGKRYNFFKNLSNSKNPNNVEELLPCAAKIVSMRN